ncbi:hypothetical protein GCM10027596_39960 [Nocardioides korecus]
MPSRDGKPFAGYGVAIRRRIEIEAPEWGDGELTGQSVTTDRAVNHFDHSTERVVVNGRLRDAAGRDGETGGKRIEDVVSLSTRFGEVGVSLKYDRARLERQTALAVTTEV